MPIQEDKMRGLLHNMNTAQPWVQKRSYVRDRDERLYWLPFFFFGCHFLLLSLSLWKNLGGRGFGAGYGDRILGDFFPLLFSSHCCGGPQSRGIYTSMGE